MPRMAQLAQPQEPAASTPPSAPSLARSAGLLAIGSAASRVLGLLREMVIAALFGATGEVSAFRVAAQAPVLLYDLLMGGMLSAALVPVLSQYAVPQRRPELIRLVSVLATLFAVGVALLVLLLELAAPQVAWLLAGGFRTSDPALLTLTTRLLRWTLPVLWLLSMAGLTTAILYALQRFSFPALAAAIYNLGIVVAAPLLAPRMGIAALVVGMLLGAAAQLLIMAFDLGRAGVRWRLRINLRHPALRRIVWLYLPIALGLVVSLGQTTLDRRLASATGAESIAWMANATTLQQMPLGLISVAISLAALPQLSQAFAAGDRVRYQQILGQGLRLVLLLIVPAAVLLWTLGEPITRILFERVRFTAFDTQQVTAALNIYVVGMLCAAVDFPLNYAFYARNNTWLPALVGVISVGVYVAAAFALMPRLGYLGLVWADTAKQAGHVLIMLVLTGVYAGSVQPLLGRSALWIVLAGAAAAGAAWGLLYWGPGLAWLLRGSQFVQDLTLLAVVGGAALGVYGLVLHWTGVPELAMVVARLRRSKPGV